jgi:hypothetical protein
MYTYLQFALTHMQATEPPADCPSQTRSAFPNADGLRLGAVEE